MSVDGADEIHGAEDHIGVLRAAIEELAPLVHAKHKGLLPGTEPYDWRACGDPSCQRLVGLTEPYVRSSCDAHECGEDCGGYHPPDWRDDCTEECPEHREEEA